MKGAAEMPWGATGVPENGSLDYLLGKKCGCSSVHVATNTRVVLALGGKTPQNTFGSNWFHPFNSKGKVFTWPQLSKIITAIHKQLQEILLLPQHLCKSILILKSQLKKEMV